MQSKVKPAGGKVYKQQQDKGWLQSNSNFANYFRKIDAFGKGVALTYNNLPVYQTSCGAMATVLMYIILAVYAVDGFILVISD
jgi:hypothetical protein